MVYDMKKIANNFSLDNWSSAMINAQSINAGLNPPRTAGFLVAQALDG